MALCIACQDQSCDGKVFLVDTLDTINMAKIATEHVDQQISKILSRDGASPQLLYYEPVLTGEAMPRILRQRSVFVVGRPLVPEQKEFIWEVEVARIDKPAILADLELVDFSYGSLFQDIYGFAESNNVHASLSTGQVDFKQMGNGYYQDGDYSKAIDAYTQFSSRFKDDYEVYFLRGNAHAASSDYNAALRDFDKAIDLGSNEVPPIVLYMLYFNRANAKSEIGDLEGALGDYGEAHNRNAGSVAISFNRANTLYDLGKYREAVVEYDKCDTASSAGVHFNRGNALLILGELEQAIEAYETAAAVEPSFHGLDQNLWAVRGLLEATRGIHFEIRMKNQNSLPKKLVVEVFSDALPEYYLSRSPLLVGRMGNSGSFGGLGLAGGSGFKGEIGFPIVVRNMAQ